VTARHVKALRKVYAAPAASAALPKENREQEQESESE
jgi:hypothetical protein